MGGPVASPSSPPVINQTVVASPPPAEPGYTTTEFWASQVSTGVVILGALASDFGLGSLSGQQRTDISLAAAFVIGLIQAAYAVSRNLRKQGTPA